MVESTELIRKLGNSMKATFRATFAEMPNVLTRALEVIAQVEGAQLNKLNTSLHESGKRSEHPPAIQIPRINQDLNSIGAVHAPIAQSLVRTDTPPGLPITSGPNSDAESSVILVGNVAASGSHEPIVPEQNLTNVGSIPHKFVVVADKPSLDLVHESSSIHDSPSAQLEFDPTFSIN